jgi:hypothetical protein
VTPIGRGARRFSCQAIAPAPRPSTTRPAIANTFAALSPLAAALTTHAAPAANPKPSSGVLGESSHPEADEKGPLGVLGSVPLTVPGTGGSLLGAIVAIGVLAILVGTLAAMGVLALRFVRGSWNP